MYSKAASSFSAGDLPGDERAGREVGRHQRLTDPPDHSRRQHRAQPLDHDVFSELGAERDLRERLVHEAGDAILGHGEDARIDRIR